MNNEVLVKVENVSKKFCKDLKTSLWYGVKDLGVEFLGRQSKKDLRKKEFWSVKDVSFELKRGECLGLIGHNGAGKSTLLKMLNGLIKPDTGKITMRGRIGALIELGAGFNPLLTGRENVYINGQLLGFSKKEIDEKFDAIVDFAELEEFIDTPVRNYSSGMKVRLGFAVAAQMEPDVLIIDEVLAVGDLGFILKCFRAIDKLLEKSAVIFVSHSMPQVSRISSGIILMDKGIPVFHGEDVSQGIDLYYNKFPTRTSEFTFNDDAQLLSINLGKESNRGVELYQIKRLEDLLINLTLKIKKCFDNPFVAISVYDKEQRPVGVCHSTNGIGMFNSVSEGTEYLIHSVNVTIPRINLSKGKYSLAISVAERRGFNPLLRIQTAIFFQVISEHNVWPSIEFEGIWK